MNALELREGWRAFLARYPWDVFITLTFDRKHHSYRYARQGEKADRDFRRLIRFVNEKLYGRRWSRRTKHGGVIWVRVMEPHEDGTLHYHAALHSPSESFTPQLVQAIRDWWQANLGMARSEAPKSREAVVAYLTKNLGDSEGAEVDISFNFRAPD